MGSLILETARGARALKLTNFQHCIWDCNTCACELHSQRDILICSAARDERAKTSFGTLEPNPLSPKSPKPKPPSLHASSSQLNEHQHALHGSRIYWSGSSTCLETESPPPKNTLDNPHPSPHSSSSHPRKYPQYIWENIDFIREEGNGVCYYILSGDYGGLAASPVRGRFLWPSFLWFFASFSRRCLFLFLQKQTLLKLGYL